MPKNSFRRSKYGNKRVKGSDYFSEIATRNFDSKFEAAVAMDLCIRLHAGEIKDLKFQPVVLLSDAQISWKIDFSYVEIETGELIYHEAKGFRTEGYRLKLALYKAYGPAKLRVTRGNPSTKITKEYVPRGVRR